ncbi:Deoxycytidylate deaminase [Stenotrophomonas indicatrix]|uniref:Deoxycytidylate deaminase n=1 Tax=Stenotrophomonas indicatrix TaxID=2045451 RepID=A0A1W1GYX7_9GAMM|nr:Deoxycytidylate deaminase [Stenotrophomonas indicatrix]
MGRDLTNGIERAYAERLDLFVVALTGRTGSGCTTTASALCREFADLPSSSTDLTPIEVRKQEICSNFSQVQWVPFRSISVSTVIFGYILTEEPEIIEPLFLSLKLDTSKIKEIHARSRSQKGNQEFTRLVKDKDSFKSKDAWFYYVNFLIAAANEFRSHLGTKYSSLFQTLGDNIRHSGSPTSNSICSGELFSLASRVKRLALSCREHDIHNGTASTRIVIDAVRNPLELVYLRDQFAAFFAFAITAEESHRRSRLTEAGMSKRDIDALDNREYSKKSLTSYDNFVSQNIEECIQKSDVFVNNPGTPDSIEQNKLVLNRQLIRYISLICRPGLVTPTHDERCMQLAFAAKLNSGCISRQVGASISDANSSIKAVGWNDVPKGQVPCLLRDSHRLIHGDDQLAFSDYEKNNSELRNQVASSHKNAPMIRIRRGLPCPFCFKDAYNAVTKKPNQVHTRSLHAEENAFLQLAKHGNSGIAGGNLYTTASPCELCSKKAFQLGIREVIYVDPYPGISLSHVLRSGPEEFRPKLRLFQGAVGHAYHRIYEPILPIKDEYSARLGDDPDPTLI